MWLTENMSFARIYELTRVPESTAERWVNKFLDEGATAPIVNAKVSVAGAGSRALHGGGVDVLLLLLKSFPKAFLREHVARLDWLGFKISRQRLGEVFARMNITRKKVIKEYANTARSLRHAWELKRNLIALGVKMEHLVFQDETWKDAIDVARLYGWAPRGVPIIEFVAKLGSTRRYGVIGACDCDGIIDKATFITRENIDAEVFTKWFIDTLLPQMNAFPAPRSVVLLDGAGFHDIPALVAAAEARGVWVLTCAPMRPQDNAIEMMWNIMKQQLIHGDCTGFEADAVRAITLALASITPDMARKCFAKSGFDAAFLGSIYD